MLCGSFPLCSNCPMEKVTRPRSPSPETEESLSEAGVETSARVDAAADHLARRVVAEALTFDDVLLLPRRSDVLPSEVDTTTWLTPHVSLQIPLVSAAMDTVTEAGLAISLAQSGGLGIIHKNLPPEDQVREVEKVKRSAHGVIADPHTLPPDATIGRAQELMTQFHISGLPIVDDGDVVIGILTNRDLRFHRSPETKVAEVMTKDLVSGPPQTSLEEAKDALHRNKIEKFILLDEGGRLAGLITMRDINEAVRWPHACRDGKGRLRVGAAVGVHEYERGEALVGADVDVIVVDTAHGHSGNVLETVRQIKQRCDIDVIAGNVATAEGAAELIAAGAAALKVGIGPGSICTTRVVSGVGVPQLTAIANVVSATQGSDVKVIADGGIRHSGDIVKALAMGADVVMLGALFAGLDESPGERVLYKGRTYKTVRGMGSLGAMVDGSSDRYGQGDVMEAEKLVPEGVEGLVPYKGPLAPFVYQLVGGVRSGMGYLGVEKLEGLRRDARFVKVSAASLQENHPHDIEITKEAPNYQGRT